MLHELQLVGHVSALDIIYADVPQFGSKLCIIFKCSNDFLEVAVILQTQLLFFNLVRRLFDVLLFSLVNGRSNDALQYEQE